MARYPRLMPATPQLFSASVVRTERISPSFQRVTVGGAELGGFEWLGFDQWFRLFLPPSPSTPLQLPRVSGRSWYRSYLLIPESLRPHCANYTVAGFRRTSDGVELDIDVVLHWHGGALAGTVARWAESARPGSPVGLLGQGCLFDPPPGTADHVLAGDETGVPGLRGILASLDPSARGVALLEVPDAADCCDIAAPTGVEVRWLPRSRGRSEPGRLALAALAELNPPAHAYAYVVGESGLATGGRRVLKRAGVPPSQITFSGFWKA